MAYRPDDPATEKQVNYLDALSKELVTLSVSAKAYDLEGHDEFEAAAKDVVDALAGYNERGDLTKSNASRAIDYIIETNRVIKAKVNEAKSRVTLAPVTVAGFDLSRRDSAGVYVMRDGSYTRVYYGQQSGNMLAKRLRVVDGEYEYQYIGMAQKHAKMVDRKMTIDEAKSLGKATGTCCVCGRRLDDPESVDAGIGPVCASKF